MLKNRKLLATVSAFALALGIAAPASAATTGTSQTDVTINSGTLQLVSPPANLTFPDILIDGTTKTVSGTLGSLQISDLRGTAEGWNVDVNASQFASTNNPSNKLSTNILQIENGSPTISTNGAGTAPTYQISTPTSIDGGSNVKVLSAGVGAGTGTWDIAFQPNTLNLTVDTSNVTLDGGAPTVFSSTLTWTVSTGP